MDPTTNKWRSTSRSDHVIDTLSTLAIMLDRTIGEIKTLGSESLEATLNETRTKLKQLCAERETERVLLSREIERVESLIRDISSVINDPNAELPVVIQKDVERSELESYVRGIRFVLETGYPK
jgi:hypothetical protein